VKRKPPDLIARAQRSVAVQAISDEGRWCEARVWPYRPPGVYACSVPEDPVPCGGELRHARRCEGNKIVTYLACLFCGRKTPVLSYDRETGELVDLLKP